MFTLVVLNVISSFAANERWCTGIYWRSTLRLSVFFFSPAVEMWVCQSHIKATHPSVISIYSFQVLKSSSAFLLRQSWSCSAVCVVWRSRLCSGPLVSTELKHTWKEGRFCTVTYLHRGTRRLWIMFLHWQTRRLYTLTLPQKQQKNLLQDQFNLLKLTLTTKEVINGMDQYLQQKPKWWPPSRWCRTRRSASPRSACQRTWRSLRCKLPKPTELENLAMGVKINIFSVVQMIASRLKTTLHT